MAAADATARAARRGHGSRRRRTGVIALGVVVASLGLLAVAWDRPSDVTTDDGSASVPVEAEPGDAAVWTTAPDAPPAPTASTFTALVSRLGCHGGVTGEVLRPGVVAGADEVVVTFTVEAAGTGDQDCPSNDVVPYVVDVGVAIGDRALVDGSCRPGGPAETTTFCDPDGVRW